MIYRHPVTGEKTMCFSLGHGICWGLIESEEYGKPEEDREYIHIAERWEIIKDLKERANKLKYVMEWEKGDLAFLDNRAVCH